MKIVNLANLLVFNTTKHIPIEEHLKMDNKWAMLKDWLFKYRSSLLVSEDNLWS
jgi:hypothetical protein